MSLYAEYRPRSAGEPRSAPPPGLLIRPATPADVPVLAAIEAEREGGPVEEHAERLARAVAAAPADRLVLAALVSGRPIGIARARHFSPPVPAPADVAPAGYYLSGVIVAPEHRRRGVGRRLTRARMAWVAERSREVYTFANAKNLASIDLLGEFGFVEVTRAFSFPGVKFQGGEGILFRAALGAPGGPGPAEAT